MLSKLKRYFSQGIVTGSLVLAYIVLNKANLGGLLRDRLALFRCSHGYKFYAPLADHWRFTGKQHFEPYLTSFMESVITSGDIVIDVGAHIGIHTVHAAKLGGYVFSIEPIPSNIRLLERNIQLNNVSNSVELIKGAACDHKGIGTIYVHNYSGSHSMVYSRGARNVIRVPCFRLDSLFLEKKHIKLIKIDVEGFEVNVVRGMESILSKKSAKYIVIEVDNSSFAKITEIMARYGYRLYKRLENYKTRFNVIYALL